MTRWFRAMLSVGLSLGWVACSVNPAALPFWAPTATPGPQTLTCPVHLGVIISRTGAAAIYEDEIDNGYTLAVMHINASGGVRVGGKSCLLALTRLDDTSTIAGGLAAFAELDAAGVPLILGTTSDEVTASLVPQAGRHQVPLLAHNANGFLITDNGYDWVFRTLPSAWETMSELLAYVRTLSLATPATMTMAYEDSPLGHSYTMALIAQAKQQGFLLDALEAYPTGQSNYDEVLTSIAASAPRITIFAGAAPADAAALLQSSQLLPNQPLYLVGGQGFNDAAILQNPLANQLILAVPWTANVQRTDELSDRTNAEFVADYQAAFAGAMPTYRSASAYVNIFLAKAALEQAVVANLESNNMADIRVAVRDQLATLAVGQTLIGAVQFDATGQNKGPLQFDLTGQSKPTPLLLIVQVVNQQLEIVYPPELATAKVVLPAQP